MNEFTKGLNSSESNVFKAVTYTGGLVQFAPIKMLNLCFVRHDNQEDPFKTYVFKNPTSKRLPKGTRIVVSTCNGDTTATVVSSIKIQQKYLKELMAGVHPCGVCRLRPVVGVIEKEGVDENGSNFMMYKLIKKWAEEDNENTATV